MITEVVAKTALDPNVIAKERENLVKEEEGRGSRREGEGGRMEWGERMTNHRVLHGLN